MTAELLKALQGGDDGWHSECVMSHRISVLREAVQELAWFAVFNPQVTRPTDDDWARSAEVSALAQAIVEAKETTDA